MKIIACLLPLCGACAWAQSSPDRILGAMEDRTLSEKVAGLKTDDRIAMYSLMASTRPENPHYQVLLASAYMRKTRETTDYSYLDRATSMLDQVLRQNRSNYEAQRLLTETQLERHMFAEAARLSRRLIQIDPADPWNWGTLGDALIESGEYHEAAEAYQTMVRLRPDLASYNRAAHYRFLFGDVTGAIEIMKKAIEAGSGSAENVAWCMVDLGNIYLKTGQLEQAQKAFGDALRTFKSYHPAYAGLGKVLAETRDLKGAIASYRRAQEIAPLPDYAAALYDLYKKTGQDSNAAQQMSLLEAIDKLGRANGERANRSLVFAFADHDVKLDRALELAEGELTFRKDIYTCDALAWALYKNHRSAEAQQYMAQALKLSTPEPAFQLHAEAIREALEREPK